jgi:hypothetical protein
MKSILDQLARSGLLVDDDMLAAILDGTPPPMENIILDVIFGVMDCEAVVRADPKSTWNEKRIARQCLAIAFLSAFACLKEQEFAS